MAQHHFVVVFDDEAKEWYVDFETTLARFDEGLVWFEEDDDNPAEWVKFSDLAPEEKDNARDISKKLRDLLQNAGQGV